MFFTEKKTRSLALRGYDTKFLSKKIKLPVMDSYPLQYFSQVNVNFEEAIPKFPCLEGTFLKFIKLQKTCEENKNLINWYSICINKNINRKTVYAEIILEYPIEKKEESLSLIESLGIF